MYKEEHIAENFFFREPGDLRAMLWDYEVPTPIAGLVLGEMP
jgi:hypothetical protein